MKKTQLFLMLLTAMLMTSCSKSVGYGDLKVNIGYSINGNTLVPDSLCYVNEAGNEFMINEIQWFISQMELESEQGHWYRLDHKEVKYLVAHTPDWVFYIDTDIPESQTLEIAPLPVGKYKTLRFNFGLNEEDNQTGLYTNPPEANMFWPEPLGGGYHYMKLNGKFLDHDGALTPLNVHLGIGQNADHTEFYQNYFTVQLPIDFTIAENAENQLDLTMIVDNWFRQPNLHDFNDWGSAIMQNQAAQQVLKENGANVFVVGQPIENQNDIAMKKEEMIWKKLSSTLQKAAPKPHFWTFKSVKVRMGKVKI